MELLLKSSLLKEIPLFSELSEDEFNLIVEKSSIVEYKKGDIIYRQGSAPSAFYYVILGRVVIYTEEQGEDAAILEYLHRGKYFGIISLLTGDAHSVTAKAMNDCLILTIKDDDFGAILKKIPSISIDLGKTLSRRLKRKNLHQKTIFESTIISVFSIHPDLDKAAYVSNLALSLRKETHKTVIIAELTAHDTAHRLPQALGVAPGYPVFNTAAPFVDNAKLQESIIKVNDTAHLLCLHFTPGDQDYLKNMVNILNLFTNDYHYIVTDLSSRLEHKSLFGSLNQSDLIHFLVKPRLWDLKRNRRLIDKLQEEYNYQKEKIRVVITGRNTTILTLEEELRLLNQPVFATLPDPEAAGTGKAVLDAPDAEYSRAIRRIARQEGNCQVGLALGVGVAYGFCHIGVLKVIEENKIPIDVICGASMGALIASLWATGKSSEQIFEVTSEFKEPKYIWDLVDLTFPFFGFLKGNKLYQFLKRHLGNKTFFDTRIPLRIVTCDVKKKETKLFDKGLLADAIMASCAMPGVFSPFTLKEEMLFDGGVINPLPTEPLFEMGVKKIIAVNVTPSREDLEREYAKMQKDITLESSAKKKRTIFGLKEYMKNRFKTNILDIIFSSIEIMQSAVAKEEGQLADIVLHPDTTGLHWMELNKAEAFAKRGEEEAKKKLEKIMQLLND